MLEWLTFMFFQVIPNHLKVLLVVAKNSKKKSNKDLRYPEASMIKKSCQFFSRGEQILTENCLFAYFRSFQAHHGSMVGWDISTRHGSMVCVEISLRGWGHIQKNPKRHTLKFDPFRGFATRQVCSTRQAYNTSQVYSTWQRYYTKQL